MKKGTLVILILILFNTANTQTANKVETLLQELKLNTNQDSFKVKTLLAISSNYMGSNPSQMLNFAKDAANLAKQINFHPALGDGIRYQGIANYILGNFIESENKFTEALNYYTNLHYNKGIIACLSNLGSINNVKNNFPQALSYYQKALKLCVETNDDLQAGINNGNMGIIYSEMKDYNLALKHFKGGLEIHTKINYADGISNGLGNVGNVYFNLKEYYKAQEYYVNALNKYVEVNNKFGMAREYGNIANVFTELKMFDSAFIYHNRALAINEVIKNKKGIAVNYQGIANYYYQKQQFAEAYNYVYRANILAISLKIKDVEKESFKTLSDIYEKINKTDSAYWAFKKYIEVKDSIDNDNNRKQIARLEIQYEFDAKEDKYKTEQLLANEKLNQQNLLLAVSKLKLSESNKERDLVRLNYLKTQSELKTAQLLKQDKETQLALVELQKNNQQKKLDLAEKEKVAQLQKTKFLEQENTVTALKLKQLWLYGILILAIIAGLFAFFIGRLRTKSLKAKNELVLQKIKQVEDTLQLQNEIKEAEMQTLRSQMNPHFMFNSLNSINSYIVQNKSDEASGYLMTFSKLMRNILENSKHTTISLQKEITSLKHYLELEAARLNNKFIYSINIQKNIDVNYLQIAPLILQPFVENAIWHGLQNKLTKGHLSIEVTTENDELLLVKITDDGIGRKASALLNVNKTNHNSVGIDITVNRIKMLNSKNSVAVIDLYGENEVATGTQVILKLFY